MSNYVDPEGLLNYLFILLNLFFIQLFSFMQVFEVRPVIDWNKGKAVEFLLESLGLDESEDVLPIYVGDDKTDEDAFKVYLSSLVNLLA